MSRDVKGPGSGKPPSSNVDGEALFRLAVEAAPNAMVMVNERGAIAMVNAQTERDFGYHRSELLGQPIERLLPARFNDRHPGRETRS